MVGAQSKPTLQSFTDPFPSITVILQQFPDTGALFMLPLRQEDILDLYLEHIGYLECQGESFSSVELIIFYVMEIPGQAYFSPSDRTGSDGRPR